MSYNPITDFLALLRNTSGGERTASIPGLDYVVAAMARVGLFSLSVGQTAPTANQSTTVWLRPSNPSWVAEGAVFLWNAVTASYQPATPALWSQLLSPSGYVFQSAPNPTNIITAGVSLLAVQRAAPAATALVLPNLASQFATGKKLQIVDFSTGVTNHAITVATPDGSTIMQQVTWELLSSSVQLSGVMLTPSPDLNAWVIAP